MAVLDRYLEAMSKQRAEALVFRSGAPVEMVSGGNARPVSSKAATADQIRGLFSEVLGGPAADGLHTYKGPFGAVAITLLGAPGGGLMARVEPAPAGDAPLEPATPVPPRATEQSRVSGGAARGAPKGIDDLFHQMLDLRASDLHLKANKIPQVRVDGSITPLPDRPVLDGETLHRFVHSIMPERNQEQFKESNDTDFAYELAGRARMRCNVFRDLSGPGAVFRQIPAKIMTARELNLPRAVIDFCQFDKGLVVVTGPTGSGKSTTLAAMVDWINDNRDDHLITIEDPVEFVHQDKKCLINQREVGTHTKGFKNALRAALREDPDIVLVGEMRDLETVAIAIETAETGHLVFGTLHTSTAASTVDRIIDQFPADRQAQIRVMLAGSLRGVISQTLCKKLGGGRVAAREVLLTNPAVSNLIREGKTYQIPTVMQTSRRAGMVTLNDALLELLDGALIAPAEGYMRSLEKAAFLAALKMRGLDTSFADETAVKP